MPCSRVFIYKLKSFLSYKYLKQLNINKNFNPFDSPKNLGLGVGNCFCNFVNWLQMSFVVMFFWVVAARDRQTTYYPLILLPLSSTNQLPGFCISCTENHIVQNGLCPEQANFPVFKRQRATKGGSS